MKADGTAQVRHAVTLCVICTPMLNWGVFLPTAATGLILRCGKVSKDQVVRYFKHSYTGIHVCKGHYLCCAQECMGLCTQCGLTRLLKRHP